MRILFLTTKPPWPPHDGGAVASMRMIEGLASHGVTISVLSITTPKHNRPTEEPIPAGTKVIDYRKTEVDTTIRLFRLIKNLFFSRKPYDLQRFYSKRFTTALCSLPDIGNYDIIQCEGLVFALYVRDIRALTNAKIVLRAHNIEHHIKKLMAQQEKRILRRWYLFILSSRIKRIESGCRNIFDAIVAITEDDSKWFGAQRGISPVIVSETGADLTVMAKKKPTGDYKVGFIGALDWQPNIDGLLCFLKEVWPGIVEAIPQAALHIGGKNASPHLCKMITGSNVVFRGEIDDAEAFTSSMTVMIAPLFAGSGMRIKIIEAMNAGTPVVASPVAAKGLPVTDRKDILIGRTRDEFQNAIAELLTDSITREKIAFNAKALIREKFDNDKLTGRLLEFYNTLQNGR